MSDMKFLTQGETGLVVEFGTTIDPTVNASVHTLARQIKREALKAVEAVVPTYRSLLVIFDPLKMTRQELTAKIKQIAEGAAREIGAKNDEKIVTIPTCYGGEHGTDIDFVAKHNNMTKDEVIAIHTSVAYQIYMIGFTPAFPYLGGMSEKIAAPRLEKPRTIIPAGSVGIAGTQTGLYPVESPGGWQLIGRTPLKVFMPERKDPFIYAAGDFLKFEAISQKDYDEILNAVEQGAYKPKIQARREVAS